MNRLASILSACTLLSCLAASMAAGQIPDSLSDEQLSGIDSAVTAVMTERGVTGLQVAIGIGDRVVWTDGYGMADLENFAPITTRSLFRTASISKWLTATAALRLVEQGKLDLDAPVQRYCPEFPGKRWEVTTRHLLSHRSGVRHYWGANREPRDTEKQREALQRLSDEERLWMIVRYTDVIKPLNRFKDDSLLFEPGIRYRYTSFGYRLVGCVLKGAAEKPYRELMDELVFHPAGMTRTQNDDAYAIIPGRVRGYTRTDDGELLRSRFRDVSENLPAGGHLSTSADLVRFALAFHSGVLVSRQTRDRMTAPPRGTENEESYYGFGVNVLKVEELGGQPVYFHSGGQDETRTLLALLPAAGVAVAIMTNYEQIGGGLNELTRKILEIVLGG